VDQSESAVVADLSTTWLGLDWSSEFVTLTEVGPNLGTQTDALNIRNAMVTRYEKLSADSPEAAASLKGSVEDVLAINPVNVQGVPGGWEVAPNGEVVEVAPADTIVDPLPSIEGFDIPLIDE
jgi:hypothetical protein